MNLNALMSQHQVSTIADNSSYQLQQPSILQTPMTAGLTSTPKSSLLFIDANVGDWQTLARATTGSTEVHLLQSGQDAIQQITQTLLGRSGIESVAIVSHGESGGLQLGESWLNATNLNAYATELRSWGNALTETADILLYGCNIAADAIGTGFVNLLAQATGADVAASNDLTGYGGDWDLEVATGGIETAGLLSTDRLAEFRGTLNWQQLGVDIDGAAGDLTGYSVSLSNDGRTVVVASPGDDGGNARVYRFNNNAWTQVGGDLTSGTEGVFFGHAASISNDGNTVAIGDFGNDGNGANSGHVRIFRFTNNAWTQLGVDIDGEAAGDSVGSAGSVALSADGNTVAIGAFGNDGNGANSGHVRIFNFNGTAWTQVGADIDGEAAGDFLSTVAISDDGSTVATAAFGNDANGSDSGHVRIYRFINNAWTQLGSDFDGSAANARFGYSVALSADGNTAAIGAIGAGNDNSGLVQIYRFADNTWTQVGLNINGEAGGDSSGNAVTLSADGNTVAIAAQGNDGNGNDSGHVRVYRLSNNAWTQLGIDLNGEAELDGFGKSVSLSADGNTVAIGTNGNSANGDFSGHARIYSFDPNSLPSGGNDGGQPPAANSTPSELLVRNKVTGEITILYTDPTTQQSTQRSLTYGVNFGELAGQAVKISVDWTTADTDDVNGDGITDVLLHNKMGDEVAIWLMGANGTISQATSLQQNGQILRTQNTNWRVVGFADLDQDNTLDVVWHNRESDEVGIWFMNADGVNVRAYDYLREASGQVLKTNSTRWQVDGLSDFDGDGDMDLLFRLPELNQTSIVRLNGKTVLEAQFITSNGETTLVVDQISDSDNNGTADIYWRNPVTNQILLQPLAIAGNTWQSVQFNLVENATSGFQAILKAQGQTIEVDLSNWELLELDDLLV
jgi:hypothetical protein